MTFLLLIHTAVTFMLVGLILTIQFLHYPLLNMVGRETFVAYQLAHIDRITFLVGPLMVAEVFTALALAALQTDPPGRLMLWVSFALIGVIWVMTACVNVPQHTRLAGGFDAATHAALVATNWVRTLAWSGRGLLLIGVWSRLGVLA